MKRKIFDDAMRVAAKAMPWRAHGKSVPWTVKLRWRIADRLVYSKIRAGVGGRIRIFSSGGAPLAPELAEFFWSVGLPVYQGYGLTETSPVVTFNSPKSNKVGTVGRPIPNVQVRLADDGEILVKGPCVMQGYYQKPEETREVLTPDGWFSTGDIGRIDADGFLSITDRKKELLKTAGGKFVAPAPIENMLKTSPLISNAMVVGDRRKFVSVLVVVNFAGIEEEARKAGREFSTAAQAIRYPWVRDLMSHEIERLTSSLAQYEKPKRFALLEQDFTYANGELTYTLKLKRRVIEARYQDTIARLYADVEEPHPQPAGIVFPSIPRNHSERSRISAERDMTDRLVIAGRAFRSRLIVGTGKYRSFQEMARAHAASGAEMVTVAVRRVNLTDRSKESLLDYIDRDKLFILPNTAGCYSADEAVRAARLGREVGLSEWVKLEVIGDEQTLFPETEELIRATKTLVQEGFIVLPYTSDDLIVARKLIDAGASAVMPLGAPIGSGMGIQNLANLRILRERITEVPLIVDAGVGTASDAAIAMELGADGVLMNTAIAGAQDAVLMAEAMCAAVEAGRKAFLAGRIEKKLYATASSPTAGVVR